MPDNTHKPICHTHNHKECPACMEMEKMIDLYKKQTIMHGDVSRAAVTQMLKQQEIIDLQGKELTRLTKLIGDCPDIE